MKNLWKISIVCILLTMCCWTWIGWDLLDSVRCLRMDDQAFSVAVRNLYDVQNITRREVLREAKRELDLLTRFNSVAGIQLRMADVLIDLQKEIRSRDPRLSISRGLASALVIHGAQGHGSGFFIDKVHGIILTAGHVTKHGEQEQLYVKQGEIDVPVLYARWDNFTDVGLALIDPIQAQRFVAGNVLLSSDSLKIGDMLISAGYPLEMNDAPYASVGVVVGQDVNDAAVLGPEFSHFVKFQLEIDPGMSGGPILNVKGEIVSINSVSIIGTQISCGPSEEQIIKAIVRIMRQRPGDVRLIPASNSSEDPCDVTKTTSVLGTHSS